MIETFVFKQSFFFIDRFLFTLMVGFIFIIIIAIIIIIIIQILWNYTVA